MPGRITYKVGQALPPAIILMLYTRRLPHIHPDESGVASLFITWRLTGSLPKHRQHLLNTKPEDAGKAFVSLDREADKARFGPTWLKNPQIATVVRDTLIHGEARRLYDLGPWVIMPNHVHVLIQPVTQVHSIMRWVKGSSARKANLILSRTGSIFWQDESYDRWVRNTGEWNRIARHIEWNPVAAGLVERPEDWLWSSAAQAGESACPTSSEV